MITRHAPAFTIALLAVGITMGTVGLFSSEISLTRAGVFLTITALPLLVIRALREQHQNSEDKLAAAHAEGYRLALDHVARGLLDQPRTAPPCGGQPADAEQAAGVVIPLRSTVYERQERQAL